ncbi:hypothetical protein KFL_001680110 [Klebsormidium nitens]|uniref:Uncharacterized protein n=1 Tax=Klebsormidium nitens TaxID=105231 RepID=A0A1Y1I5C8_KLENI|nr:hypothetical protein KFL_001680110 [Klebsormidium nitens]|eukprot:GAQ83916.1 hypothetical protein KFL_001680110 [Klebsormidium nitens]
MALFRKFVSHLSFCFSFARLQPIQVRYCNGIRNDYLARDVKANLEVDTPIAALFRLVDLALAGRFLSLRDEVEFFWWRAVPTEVRWGDAVKSKEYNMHYEKHLDADWLVHNVPDPRSLAKLPPPFCEPVFMLKAPTSKEINQYRQQHSKYASLYATEEGCRQLRIVIAAAFAAELCEAFNCRIQHGLARGRADDDDHLTFGLANKGRLQLETPPDWEKEVGKQPVEELGCLRFFGMGPEERRVGLIHSVSNLSSWQAGCVMDEPAHYFRKILERMEQEASHQTRLFLSDHLLLSTHRQARN